MSQRLSVPDIANVTDVEEKIIRRVLERHDEDLKPYLHAELITTSHSDEQSESQPDDGEKEAEQPQSVLRLNLDGLPVLITKLAFNIPTSDLIENLACQVLHLTILQEDNAELESENQEVQRQNEHLQHSIEKVREEVKTLQTKVTQLIEIQSRGWFRNLFERPKPE